MGGRGKPIRDGELSAQREVRTHVAKCEYMRDWDDWDLSPTRWSREESQLRGVAVYQARPIVSEGGSSSGSTDGVFSSVTSCLSPKHRVVGRSGRGWTSGRNSASRRFAVRARGSVERRDE